MKTISTFTFFLFIQIILDVSLKISVMKRFLCAKYSLGFGLLRLIVPACKVKIIVTIYITRVFYVSLIDCFTLI